MPRKVVQIKDAGEANGEGIMAVDLPAEPKDYVQSGTDEDTGHDRRKLDFNQSIHGDTVRAFGVRTFQVWMQRYLRKPDYRIEAHCTSTVPENRMYTLEVLTPRFLLCSGAIVFPFSCIIHSASH